MMSVKSLTQHMKNKQGNIKYVKIRILEKCIEKVCFI